MKKLLYCLLIMNFFAIGVNASEIIQESPSELIKKTDSFVDRYNSEKKGLPTKTYANDDEIKYQTYKDEMDKKNARVDKAYKDAMNSKNKGSASL